MERISVGGIPFVRAEKAVLVAHLCERAEKREGESVFTPNAEMAARAGRDSRFAALLREADVCVPDGVGISLAARLCGKGRLPRIAGIELGEALLEAAAERGIPVFFYGGKEGVAEEAAKRMRKRHPALSVAGCLWGYGDPLAAAKEIRRSGAPIVLVCLGAPRQEEFIAAHLSHAVALGLGGSFDVWAGRVPRAPLVFRRLGMEWLFRILREPRRISRIFPAIGFLLGAVASGFAHLRQRKGRKVGLVNKN